MIQDIKFQGLSNSPSDNSVQDGELGSCLNLIPEDGELKPVSKPEIVENFTLPNSTCSIIYLHKVIHGNEFHSHYLLNCTNGSPYSWYWTEKGGDGTQHGLDIGDFKVNSVAAVGNILCLVGDLSIKYLYWVGDNYQLFDRDNFNYAISIGFNDIDIYGGLKEITLGDDFWDYVTYETSPSESRKITGMNVNQVSKAFNMFDANINKNLSDKGKKWQKYFVFGVAAVRLYDGTRYNISNIFKLDYNGETLNSVQVDPNSKKFVSAGPAIVAWTINVNMDKLDKVSNLVQGIDIFLSKAESFVNFESAAAEYFVAEGNDKDQGTMFFTMMSGKEAASAIDSLTFYHSLFISKDEFGKTIELKRVEGTEESLSLANLYRSDLGGGCAITYNNRLHVGNVKDGYNVNLLSDITPVVSSLPGGTLLDDEGIVHVKASNKEFWCKVSNLSARLYYFVCVPILYVAEITFYKKTGTTFEKSIVDLHSSETMAFSFYVKGEGKKNVPQFALPWEKSSEEEWANIVRDYENYQTNTNTIPYSSLIKVSEAENPLVFPASNSVQVGSSVIKAMAANTRPITEGQFGDAPLYVFTDEGTWMLMLSTDGVYQARQPVNRDVCSNPDGILQIDDAVLFPTERGIMMQTGSTAKLITDALDGAVFDYMQLYKESYSKKILAVGSIPEAGIKYIPFRQFMKGADMVYDYYDARIIVFNPDCAYAYVYSLKSGLWGAMESNIKKRVNIYPESYAINGDRKIVDFYQSQPVGPTRYFLCTRPMAIGSAEAYKTMFSCITRGYFRNEVGKCGMALYASNDLFKWFPVSTSVNKFLRGMCGSPYKYFRLALIGSLSPEESLGGLSADYQERWQNKLR